MKNTHTKKRSMFYEFLKNVRILDSTDIFERSQIADALKEEIYQPGDYVIEEG